MSTVQSNLSVNTIMKRQLRSPKKHDSKTSLLIFSLLSGMIVKRKSYSFQLFKQFYLFPDESQSSERTVSKYDKLIFSDQQLHSMFKKLETKLIEAKIWAFINLKALPYIKAAKKMERPIKRLKKRIEQQHKVFTFNWIKTYAYTKITNASRSPGRIQSSSYTHIKITETHIKQETIRADPRRSNHHIVHSNISSHSGNNQRMYGSRSRSGSITRFEHDVQNGRRILLNGEIIPCRIDVKRSESPLREPEYIKISKSPDGSSQDIRYIGLTRNQLQKRENLKMQYQNTAVKKPVVNRERSNSRIIYVERSTIEGQNQVICTHCSGIHASGYSCVTPKSEKRITRLKSSSKKTLPSQGYLQHLK